MRLVIVKGLAKCQGVQTSLGVTAGWVRVLAAQRRCTRCQCLAVGSPPGAPRDARKSRRCSCYKFTVLPSKTTRKPLVLRPFLKGLPLGVETVTNLPAGIVTVALSTDRSITRG